MRFETYLSLNFSPVTDYLQCPVSISMIPWQTKNTCSCLEGCWGPSGLPRKGQYFCTSAGHTLSLIPCHSAPVLLPDSYIQEQGERKESALSMFSLSKDRTSFWNHYTPTYQFLFWPIGKYTAYCCSVQIVAPDLGVKHSSLSWTNCHKFCCFFLPLIVFCYSRPYKGKG